MARMTAALRVWDRTVIDWEGGTLLEAVSITLDRILVSFTLAVVVGVTSVS